MECVAVFYNRPRSAAVAGIDEKSKKFLNKRAFILYKMAKKCTLCSAEARYMIKDSSEYYCDECALENFSDVGVLQPIEDANKKSERLVEDAGEDISEDEE